MTEGIYWRLMSLIVALGIAIGGALTVTYFQTSSYILSSEFGWGYCQSIGEVDGLAVCYTRIHSVK